jgi:hypothetical protein
LRLLLTIANIIFVALPSAMAVTVTLAIGNCRLRHCWPSQLPSLSAITITVAVGHFRELLPWRGENCI